MNWLGKMIGLPDAFLHTRPDSSGGGVIQVGSEPRKVLPWEGELIAFLFADDGERGDVRVSPSRENGGHPQIQTAISGPGGRGNQQQTSGLLLRPGKSAC